MILTDYNKVFDMLGKTVNRETEEIRNNFFTPWNLNSENKDKLCRDVPLTEKYMREFAKWLDWDVLSENQVMSK